jgi:hypothetical protein
MRAITGSGVDGRIHLPTDSVAEEASVVVLAPKSAKLRTVYRIITFVPPNHLTGVLEGVKKIVPLTYGQYDSVAWWSAEGVEQFRPQPGAHPAAGKENLLSQLPSVRLEFSIPQDDELLDRVLNKGLIPNHPWEEPVIYIQAALATQVHLDEGSFKD